MGGSLRFLPAKDDTRFLNPIQSILAINKRLGEGHSASALQCVLLEFLEALYQGKVYRLPLDEADRKEIANKLMITPEQLARHTQPNEYTSSAGLFVSFLTKRAPFAGVFDRGDAKRFYHHIRSGLLHEASTKYGSKVRAAKESDPTCVMDRNGNGLVIYRDAFQKALLDCIGAYREDLLRSKPLQEHFIRKMDDIAQVERCFYFAYGSNLKTKQFRCRVQYVHKKIKAWLHGYTFRYNKKSKDGTSKANIVCSDREGTWGVCYEIDCYDFARLRDVYEKYYNVIEVWTETGEVPIIAKTFISKSFTTDPPNPDYVRIVEEGAKENQLPRDYITKYLVKI